MRRTAVEIVQTVIVGVVDPVQKGEFLTLVTCLQGLTMSENTSQTMLTKIYET